MLTRSVFVRRLVPVDVEKYNTDPNAYDGEWKSNPEGEIGEVVSETFLPSMEPSPENPQIMQQKMVPILGICWFETKRPPIAYEYPAFLENVDDEIDEAEEEVDEEEKE